MTKETLIKKTVEAIEKLPIEKGEEISDFVDFLLSKYEEQYLLKGISKLVENSETFNFLAEEETIYSKDDIKRQA
jgi:hypothetical protein